MDTSTIVVLGGPGAGKTMFLNSLYYHLWNGSDGLSIRAATGTMHQELLGSAEQIRMGVLPPATQALRHYEFELEYGFKRYSLRFLDYPGELFRKVFYEGIVDSNEARELYSLSTSAEGVIALADPKSVLDGTWDIDYALTTLLRFYKTDGRKHPKIVLAFTKRDETELLVGERVSEFVRKNLPHLAGELGRGMRLQHFCSIIKSNGHIQFAQAATVAAPLRSIVDAIENEQSQQRRARFMWWLAWKRALIVCLTIIAVALLVLGAFALGVLTRK